MLAGTNRYYYFLTAFIIAAQFLGGHPETSFLLLFMWVIYSVFHITALKKGPDNRETKALSPWLRIGSLMIIGLSMAAFQLLPFLATLLDSHILSARFQEAGFSAAGIIKRAFFSWRDWPSVITTFLPQFFGTPVNRTYGYPYSNYNEQTAYGGILPLALAITVVILCLKNRSAPQRRIVLFWGACAVLFAGIAFRLPLISLVNELPLLNISITGRFRLLYIFALAVLAGFGFDRFRQQDKNQAGMIFYILLGLGIISLLLISAAWAGLNCFEEDLIEFSRARAEARQGTPSLTHPYEYYEQFIEERHVRRVSLFQPANGVMYLPILFALAGGAWYRWGRRRPVNPAVWPCLFFLLALFDLMMVNKFFETGPGSLPDHGDRDDFESQ